MFMVSPSDRLAEADTINIITPSALLHPSRQKCPWHACADSTSPPPKGDPTHAYGAVAELRGQPAICCDGIVLTCSGDVGVVSVPKPACRTSTTPAALLHARTTSYSSFPFEGGLRMHVVLRL